MHRRTILLAGTLGLAAVVIAASPDLPVLQASRIQSALHAASGPGGAAAFAARDSSGQSLASGRQPEAPLQPAAPGSPKPVPLPSSLRQALDDYTKIQGIRPETALLLRQQRNAVVAFLRETLSGAAVAKDKLPFWLHVAQAVQDERTLPILLDWTRTAELPQLYDQSVQPALSSAIGAYRSAGDFRNQVLDALQGTDAGHTLYILRAAANRPLSNGWVQALADRYGNGPEMAGVVEDLQEAAQWPILQQLYERRTALSEDNRYRILQALLEDAQSNDKITAAWIRQAALDAAQARDWMLEQACDARLVLQHGDAQAAERLYQSGEQNGYLLPLDARLERKLAAMFPDGSLAEGIAAYERIRGEPYFIDPSRNQWYSPMGLDYAHPQQAIPEWRQFLRDYPEHPAADDAAYRLARCEAMAGDYGAALRDFAQAMNSGDGDMAFSSTGMLIYTLDVAMTTQAYETLSLQDIPGWIKPWLDYSHAVHLLRDRRYADAAQALAGFRRKYGQSNPFAALPHSDNPYAMLPWSSPAGFWSGVEQQAADAAQLAKLAAKAAAASGQDRQRARYAAAAFIYHHPLLYYNYLWGGDRADFLAFGVQDYLTPEFRAYESGFNPYAQAAAAFDQVDLTQADVKTGADTLFSLALSYSKLLDFGQENVAVAPRAALARKVIESAEQLIRRYPESDLADDADRLIYDYTGDKSRLQDILKRYPDSDQAAAARHLLQGGGSSGNPTHAGGTGSGSTGGPQLTTYLSGEPMWPGDERMPTDIAAWAAKHASGAFHGAKVSGDYLYLCVTAPAGHKATPPYVMLSPRGAEAEYSILSAGQPSLYRTQQVVRIPASYVEPLQLEWKSNA